MSTLAPPLPLWEEGGDGNRGAGGSRWGSSAGTSHEYSDFGRQSPGQPGLAGACN